MPAHSIFIPSLLPLESVKLGSFITSIKRPQECYHEPATSIIGAPLLNKFSFTGRNENKTNTSLGAALTRLLSMNFAGSVNYTIQVEQADGIEYSLNNSTAWFDRVITLPETRSWIEKAALRHDKIYMVVGFQTLINPRITATSAQDRQSKSAFNIAEILSTAIPGTSTPVASLSPDTLCGKYQTVSKSAISLDAPGERVYSLLYRKIKYRWLSSYKRDKLTICPTRTWLCIEGDRRDVYEEENDSDDDEDMIYVDFDDSDGGGDEDEGDAI